MVRRGHGWNRASRGPPEQWRLDATVFHLEEQWIGSTNGGCSRRWPRSAASSRRRAGHRPLSPGGHARDRRPRGAGGHAPAPRTTRSVSLTDEGARHLERAGGARRLRRARGAAAPRAARHAGGDRAGAVRPAARRADRARVPGRVPRRRRAAPLLDRVVSSPRRRWTWRVRIGGLPDSSLRSRLVGHVRWVVCASPAYLQRRGTPREPGALAQTRLHRLSRHHAGARALVLLPPGPARAERPRALAPRGQHGAGRRRRRPGRTGAGPRAVLSGRGPGGPPAAAIVLADHEPPPAPIHIVQLPGAQVRAASAFADLAVERLRARFGGQGADA